MYLKRLKIEMIKRAINDDVLWLLCGAKFDNIKDGCILITLYPDVEEFPLACIQAEIAGLALQVGGCVADIAINFERVPGLVDSFGANF